MTIYPPGKSKMAHLRYLLSCTRKLFSGLGHVGFLMELESILWLLLLDPLNQFCFQVHWCLCIDLPLSFLLHYTNFLLEFLQVLIDHVFSSKWVNLGRFRQKTKYSSCAQILENSISFWFSVKAS